MNEIEAQPGSHLPARSRVRVCVSCSPRLASLADSFTLSKTKRSTGTACPYPHYDSNERMIDFYEHD